MQRRPKITWRRPLAVLFGLTVLLALDGSGLVRVGLGCAILHESGHALAYRALWGHWPELEVSPFGICLRLRGLPMTARQELLLAAAGPLANLLACAAVQLIRYFVVERGVFQSQLTLISGIICLALGAFLILRSDIVVSILPIVFGLFVIFDSISRVQNALDLRRCGYSSWKSFLLLPVLSVVLGVIMILNPFGTMETLVMAIGIILIVEGSINLLSALYTVLAVRRFAKLHPETQSMLESLTGEDLNGDGVVAPDVTRTDAEASAVELDEVDESATVEQENEK